MDYVVLCGNVVSGEEGVVSPWLWALFSPTLDVFRLVHSFCAEEVALQ